MSAESAPFGDSSLEEVRSVKSEWGLPSRLGFRVTFAYLALYLFMNGNLSILIFIPNVQRWLTWPAATLAVWVGSHLFHLTGIAARWHGGGSGDTALDYVRLLCLAVIAVIAALVWSVLDRRRPSYPLLFAWLRFLLRLTVGLGMLSYGFAKVFPLQMREPTYAILNNTYGNSSPMTLLWITIGLHRGYEMVCGLAEVIGGVLILWRRTATLGALFSAFVMANVLLYNLYFDVPVKIYSGHLLLICVYLLLPESATLWRFFVLRQSAVLAGTWVPPASRRSFQVATRIVEGIYLIGFSIVLLVAGGFGWRAHLRAEISTPLTGAWQIDSVETVSPKGKPLSPEGQPWADLYIDSRQQGFYRSIDGALWRCGFQYDEAKHHLRVSAAAIPAAAYDWSLPDKNHLELTRVVDKLPVKLHLTRLPAPDHYPLLERKFSFINEWGYER